MGISDFGAELFDGALSQPARHYREWMLQRAAGELDASGALWRRSHEGQETHGMSVWRLDAGFSRSWERTTGINPLQEQMLRDPGQAVTLHTASAPQPIKQTRLAQRVLVPLNIGDVLGVSCIDNVLRLRTDILLTRDRDAPPFGAGAVDGLTQMAPLMIAASAQAYFLQMARPAATHAHRPSGVIDASGRVVEAQRAFRDLLRQHFPRWTGDAMPFAVPDALDRETMDIGALAVYAEHLADLTLIRVWEREALEALSPRERDVADRLADGHTYKSIARDLAITPSTVANHVHRIYTKLGIGKRRELVTLMRG